MKMIQLHGIGHQMFQSFSWQHSMLYVPCVYGWVLCVLCACPHCIVVCLCYMCVLCMCVTCFVHILICVFCLHQCVLFIHVLCMFLHVLCFYTCFMYMFCACSICAYIYSCVCVCVFAYCVWLLWEVVLFHCPFCIDGKVCDQYKREMIWVLYSLNFFLLLQNSNIPPEEKKLK